MAKKPTPVKDAKMAATNLNRALQSKAPLKQELGSYDRTGKLIPGTQPKSAPPKKAPGSYDAKGNRLAGPDGKKVTPRR